jgi:hypothetical protein
MIQQNGAPGGTTLEPPPARDPIPSPSTGPPLAPSRRQRAAGGLVLLLGAGIITYPLLLRPWYLNWGPTAEEATAALPGDDLVPDAPTQYTRAITIAAPATAVWPWLVQLGQGRGGLYSYEWLENLIGCEMTNADRVHPEWQQVAVGDYVRMYPEGKGPPPFRVAAIIPGEALILGHTEGLAAPGPGVAWSDTWAFVLRPIDAAHTRLLLRTRTHGWGAPVLEGLLEPGVFVMERGMLRGIKDRAEAPAP